MNILHATTNPPLLQRLKEMLGSSARADIAVGYFFISGFEQVAEDFDRLKKVRVLVGRTDGRIVEEVASGLQQAEALQAKLDADGTVRRSQQEELGARAVALIGEGVSTLPQTAGSEQAVRRLRDMVAAGKVEVKAYLRSPLHAKAYLCWYEDHAEPGAAVVGSSNFTLAGFTGNTELNVRVTGDAEMAELKRWFEELWADSRDISADLVTQLDRSWPIAKTPPYHVYLKALYELYGHEVGAPMVIGAREPALANFQLDAVARAMKMIEFYDGCYIGDVVGLGKTYVGAEILRQLRLTYSNEGPPLIICPAGLKPMWERTNELFGLGAEVVSQSVLAAPPQMEFDEDLGRYVDMPWEGQGRGVVLQEAYPNRGPVLVDEAHHFRNINQRYVGLRSYLESGSHKVVLISATPQNLGPRDIYRQLRLFLDETDHDIKIEPVRLEDYFRAAEEWYRYKAEFENWQEDFRQWQAQGSKGTPPPLPDQPKTPKADIEKVLLPVLVRRRRKDIKELYGDTAIINGKPVAFPEPLLDNVSYRLDKVYARAGAFAELEGLLRAHQGYRYRVTDYFTEAAKDLPEYKDLWRARNRIARLMGALLLKRLESSIEAFRSTLQSLTQSNRNFKEALESGFVPIGQTATRLLGGESLDADELLEVLEQEEERRTAARLPRAKLVHDTGDFEVDRWLDDLEKDYAVLSEIALRVHDIEPKDDDKLRTIRRYLALRDVRSAKLLIFSEAETTVQYLFRELNPGGKDDSIAMLSGANRSQIEDIVKRFAPKANLKRGEKIPGPEIRVLIATDVVSEGQNLQDCARVLNYDLHWNPVRLIQRFGRVDRIGTEHTVIHLNNMWPDLEVDRGLSLTERLLRRIQTFHDFIGLDSRLLSENEKLNSKAMYRIYEQKKLPDVDDGLDEVAAHQRGAALLQRIQEEDPKLWETITNLPDGIRSAIQVAKPSDTTAEAARFTQAVMDIEGAQIPLMSPAAQAGLPTPFDDPKPDETMVLLSTAGVTEAYAVGDDLSPRQITAAQFISTAECGPDTPAMPLPANTNERVMSAFERFKEDAKRRIGRARRPSSDTRLRRYLSKHLNLLRGQYREDTTELRRIDILRQIFLDVVPARVEAALRDVRDMQIEGDVLVRRLEALRMTYRLNPPQDGDMGEQEPEVLRIVCSDGLV
ncbi:MAG: hypothetical protein HY535_04330 [Chloroflexi bacterium]|nr:hypothetical protein [Chloroflexota bacterium]